MNQEELKVKDWNVMLVDGMNVRGAVAYEDFLQSVDQSELYDAEHFLVTLTPGRIGKMVSKYGKDL